MDGVFSNDSSVRVLLWNDFGLDRLRVDVLDAVDERGVLKARKHGFIPHMTLEYHDDPDDLPEGWGPEATSAAGDISWPVDNLYVVRGGETVDVIPL